MRTAAVFGPDQLATRLATLIPGFPAVALAVAFSGGGDSLALLAALSSLRRARRGRFALRALHVDHGLQRSSRGWARRCAALAAQLGVPFVVRRVRVPLAKGQSVEAQARAARYAVLARLVQPGEVVLTAQHLEDQAETVLLQLLRGAGIAGLAAMPASAPLGRGWLVRPLLDLPQDALLAYARARRLDWIEDPMNADLRFDRSALRHEILPRLKARWPGAVRTLARSARHAQEAQQLLAALAARDLAAAADGPDLAIAVLRRLTPARRRLLLRHWIAQRGGRVPDARRLAEIAGPLLAARPDAQPCVAWDEGAVRRHAGRLSWHPAGAVWPASQTGAQLAGITAWHWRSLAHVWLPGARGRLGIEADPRGALDLDTLPETLTVRWRLGGEHLRPRRGGPSRSVKTLLQVARVAPWERAAMPLVYAGDKLVAVADRWIDAAHQASERARARGRFVWQRSPHRARPGRADLLT